MIITIIASSIFTPQMVEYKEKLTKLGHTVNLHEHYMNQGKGGMKDLVNRMNKEHAQVKKEHDYIRYHYKEIIDSDAVLVLNFDKNGIENYIGANTFMEVGFAHVHHKKIFVLNDISDQPYIHDEIHAMEHIVLHGDLSLIQ